ncbi:MAG: type II toxin-antitoxin system RelE/ParE family toxin [Chloroflexota bacterium]
MRIFKNRWFVRFARREKLNDTILKKAIVDAEHGVVDADLGGNIIKQRIARSGQGKSGGYRTIIVFKKADKAFFVYGFSKSNRENINKDELAGFKQSAKELLSLSDEQINALVEKGALTEVSP